MDRDRITGLLIFVSSVVGFIVYGWLIFFVAPVLILQITAFIGLTGILAILAWIGWTIAKTSIPDLGLDSEMGSPDSDEMKSVEPLTPDNVDAETSVCQEDEGT